VRVVKIDSGACTYKNGDRSYCLEAKVRTTAVQRQVCLCQYRSKMERYWHLGRTDLPSQLLPRISALWLKPGWV